MVSRSTRLINNLNHEKRRIFFALWPDDSIRQWLLLLLNELNFDHNHGRVIPVANWHMTLHFIGNVSAQTLTCLQNVSISLSAEQFDLSIDVSGYFKKPKLLWLGCSKIPAALSQLHQQLAIQLSDCGFRPETRGFTPHISIVRKLFKQPLKTTIEPVHWHVNQFVLVESITTRSGVKYKVLRSYPLI